MEKSTTKITASNKDVQLMEVKSFQYSEIEDSFVKTSTQQMLSRLIQSIQEKIKRSTKSSQIIENVEREYQYNHS